MRKEIKITRDEFMEKSARVTHNLVRDFTEIGGDNSTIFLIPAISSLLFAELTLELFNKEEESEEEKRMKEVIRMMREQKGESDK